MTTTTEPPALLTSQQLNTLFQYTIEAYKTFEKLAENLSNPLTANMFKQFAVDERATRDLIEMKIAATGTARSRVTLANDLEDSLVKLLIQVVPEGVREQVDPSVLNGPVVNPEGRTDVVSDQGEVDDLLASLGF